MAITSQKGKASLAKASASYKSQVAAKSPGENKTTKGLGTLEAEAIGAPAGTSVAGNFLLGKDTGKVGKVDTGQATPLSPEQMSKIGTPQSPAVQTGVPTTVPETQALTALKNSGQSPTDIANATALTKNKYAQAHAQLQGTQVSQDAGVGKMEVQGALSQFNQEQPKSPLGGIMETDTNFDSIFTNLDKFMEPLTQKKSLVQEYKSMSKKLGIEDLNEELIDAKRIIEGTEDDIRDEVTAAGGFASDSQVQALANARNKSLIKNYNVLLESRDNAMQQLNTMMDLTMEDRKAAENEFDRKMNLTFKVAEFQQKASDNAKSGLKWAIENGGGAELLKSPYETQLAEKTLGLPSGSLKGVVEAKNLEIEKQRLDNQKLRKELGTGGSATGVSSKPIESLEDIANLDVSTITKAVMSGIGKVKDLTPTDKKIVLEDMYRVGFNPNTFVLKKLDSLAAKWDAVPTDYKGLVAGRLQPFASSRNAEVAAFEAQKQVLTREIARLNDVGVLSDQDVAAYKAAMPSRGDADRTVVDAKIEGLGGALGQGAFSSGAKNVQGAPVSAGSTIEYQGKQYLVDANGNMTPIK